MQARKYQMHCTVTRPRLEKQSLRTQQIAYLQKSVDYTKQLLEYSSATNYTDVLTSEQSLLAAQLSSINDKLQQLTAMVSLYRAWVGAGSKAALLSRPDVE